MKVRVEITDGDVMNGVARDCARCPVALALRRAVAGLTNEVFAVGVRNVNVLQAEEEGAKYHRVVAALPEPITEWIRRFDRMDAGLRGFVVPPPVFDLELALPQEAVAAV